MWRVDRLGGRLSPSFYSPLEFSGEQNGRCGAPDAIHLGDPVDDFVEMNGGRAIDLHKEIKRAAQRIAIDHFSSLAQRCNDIALLPDFKLDQDNRRDRRNMIFLA